MLAIFTQYLSYLSYFQFYIYSQVYDIHVFNHIVQTYSRVYSTFNLLKKQTKKTNKTKQNK